MRSTLDTGLWTLDFYMSKVNKLLHTRYRVNDLERTVAFYRDVLGLAEIRRHKSPRGSELVFLKAPGSSRSRWTALMNLQNTWQSTA
jgi:catechol 2,3-dioxygenase-like lactoylglutathione lyase family enzyme